ncbi:MAG TPA: efflux RND transporter periplasmic adaptor subunit [Spirochaetota bacterium]|nr:efflux RND transporter periplasmic adaptor subunit [Spirochaetota bacterium]HPS87518.1 efflux RND transporter periplasmic adaptor subunit [Spirochaetota bacterium]
MSRKSIPVVSQVEDAPDKKMKTAWWQTRVSKLSAYSVGGLTLLILLFWLVFLRPYVTTDDARVAADIIKIANRGVNGQIVKVNVSEGDNVTAGMELAELDHRTAEAQYKKAKARASFASMELQRMESLAAQNGASRQQLDKARSEALNAEGDLQLAELALEFTTLRSPVNGVVVQKLAQAGNILETNQTAVTVVDVDNAWVTANIEETYVADVRAGQKVTVYVDEGGKLTGKVLEVRKATAATFALIPSDSSAGNFIKLVQRIPVKIILDPHPGMNLRVGQSVEVKIRVH